MKAILKGHVIAESDDIVEAGGYQYAKPQEPQSHGLGLAHARGRQQEHDAPFADTDAVHRDRQHRQ